MNLERMLAMAKRDQWSVGDLDWAQTPRPMSADDEMAIVQLFTDMAGIERLAGALFFEQARRTEDPTLREIFEIFVKDEVRHAQAAQMLADHYNVHQFRVYRQNRHLTAFIPHFVAAIRYLSDDVANGYITGGEVVLDVALLRSINDYVHDGMSAQAMHLINRDESKHISIDYYMVEYYASAAYREKLRARPPESFERSARAYWTLANVLYYAKPFLQDVFFTPMELVDPSGRRIREALKRIQLLSGKPGVAELPFNRFLKTLQDTYHRPVVGAWLGGLLSRLAGIDEEFLARLYTDGELDAVRGKSFQELADEVLAIKGSDEPVQGAPLESVAGMR